MAIKILDIYGQNVASKRMGIECRINQIDLIIFVVTYKRFMAQIFRKIRVQKCKSTSFA